MKVVVIKCGGSTIDELSPSFFNSLLEMERDGYVPVFVHGGGPDINEMLKLKNIKSEFYKGLRKTTQEVMDVVEMVLVGKTNRKLSLQLQNHGLNPIGINGSDGNCLRARFINKQALGYVGDITAVNSRFIHSFIKEGFVPVITPIAMTRSGQKLNINADYAAAAVASALKAEQCLFVTDVEGIIVNEEVVDEMSVNEVNKNIDDGTIYGGMIPKVESAISAMNKGLEAARIVSGKSAIYENGEFLGTKICKKERVLVR